jgi:hypothetical protein
MEGKMNLEELTKETIAGLAKHMYRKQLDRGHSRRRGCIAAVYAINQFPEYSKLMHEEKEKYRRIGDLS